MSNLQMQDASMKIERIAREIVALDRHSDETGNDTRDAIWDLITHLDEAVAELDQAQGEALVFVPMDDDEDDEGDRFEMQFLGEEESEDES